MKLLIVDNYDSFTWNLYHLAACVSGSEPDVIENDGSIEPANYTHVILSPGPGRPENPHDFGICSRLIKECNVPLLGVCLGLQGIAAQFRGEVIHAPEPMHGRTSEVHHDGQGLFAGMPSPFRAARYHSLCVREPLPAELVPLARADDGVLMALRHRTRPLWGVQFHPESVLTEYGHELMANFLRMCA